MTMFVITLENKGHKFYLRATTWAFRIERAEAFATRELAQAALTRAATFMNRAQVKLAQIAEVASDFPAAKSVCLCGHAGDVSLEESGASSEHSGLIGHGVCKVAGCDCIKFSWSHYRTVQS